MSGRGWGVALTPVSSKPLLPLCSAPLGHRLPLGGLGHTPSAGVA